MCNVCDALQLHCCHVTVIDRTEVRSHRVYRRNFHYFAHDNMPNLSLFLMYYWLIFEFTRQSVVSVVYLSQQSGLNLTVDGGQKPKEGYSLLAKTNPV